MTQWSHSSLKMFETCKRQYHEIRVTKTAKREEHESALYGTELHAACEMYVKDKTPVPEKFAFMRPILEALLVKDGDVYAEHEMALDIDLMPCGWGDGRAWVRGIADLLIIDNAARTAWCVDYKTGSDRYADTGQLDLMSLLIFGTFPAIQKVRSMLMFVVKDSVVKHKLLREDADKLWWKYRERVGAIDAALASGVWNPTQSGLCKKHCSVFSCEMNGRH